MKFLEKHSYKAIFIQIINSSLYLVNMKKKTEFQEKK